MSLFRRLFNWRMPSGLVEISGNILVFDHCFSTDLFEEDELKPYIGGILKQLLARYSIDSFMVFNFEGSKKNNQTARIFSGYDMSAMGYPRNYEGCPLLTLEMIHHFLRSSESWLSLSQDNFLLIHSEHGGWPVLAFALAALLVYLRRCGDERKAIEMVHKHAPPEVVELYSPLDPAPSQLRYLKYVSRRHISPELWPPADKMLNLNCVIIRKVPNFDGQGGCRPIFRIYGPDPLVPTDSRAKVLFSTPKTSDFVHLYTQEDNEIIKVNVRCPVRGDIVMECITVDEDFNHEVMVFRVMFNTAFIEDNLLLLDRNQIDILWDTQHRFPVDFRVEVIFSEIDTTTSIHTSESLSDQKESFSNLDAEISHVDLSSKNNHTTDGASDHKGLNNVHDGFDVVSLQETEISNTTAEQGILDSKSVQFFQKEPVNVHSSAPKFDNDKDAVADTLSLPEAEPFGPFSQELELSEHESAPKFDGDKDVVADILSLPEAESNGTSSQDREAFEDGPAMEKLEGDTIKTTPNYDTPSVDPSGSEAGAATAEWSDTNTDTFLSGTPSSSAPSSPPRFDEDTMEAETAEAQPQSTELQI
ncbi:formin-like protein 6 [Lolium perenne]|uniref:formin-like protein 6 n=1 Tax=Lolium perenne TaxID=4522 RepID=UPI0021F52FC5|nr:formin-like protein 6 [Lolium perenne]